MEILQVTKDNALQAFKEGDSKEKALITRLFGKKHFLTNVMERVTSFEEACAETGRDSNDPYFSAARPHENAFRKWEEVCLALNEGVVLSFANPTQEKHYVWLERTATGFRFYDTYCTLTLSSTGLGSRLCLVNAPLARHFGTYFMDIINAAMAD